MDDALGSQEWESGDISCTFTLSSDMREKITADLMWARSELEESFMGVSTTKADLLEICCGENSGLAQTILDKGGEAFRVGLHNNMDLGTQHGYERARKFWSIVKPRWMWISPICGPTSQVQNMNMKDEKQLLNWKKKIRKSRMITRHSIELAKEHIMSGGHIGWELPVGNAAWNFPEIRSFKRWLEQNGLLFQVRLDGCQVGVTSHDTHEPMLKPWKIMTSDMNMARTLDFRCDGSHKHVECLGHNRAHHSERYPPKMCRLISDVVLGHHHKEGCTENPVFMSHEVAGDNEVFPVVEESLQSLSEKDLKVMKEAIRKIHVRAGHPSNRALVSTLKARVSIREFWS